MKVIVEHDDKASSYLGQYTRYIEHLGSYYKILDIEEKYLPWLGEIAKDIEYNFVIELLGEEKRIDKDLLEKENVILAFIGQKQLDERISSYYNMITHTLKQTEAVRNTNKSQWINCYSENNKITAIEYIKCIDYLRTLSSELHKPIAIYANIYVPDEMYRYRALAYKVINSYLGSMDGVLITKALKTNVCKYYTPSQKKCEFYLDHIIYLEDSFNDAIIKTIPYLYTSKNNAGFKDVYKNHRENGTLYNDIFYQSINPEEEIYVLLNPGNFRTPEYYQGLGVEAIPIIGNYGMIYGKKSIFEMLSETLKLEVSFPFYVPILSGLFCDEKFVTNQVPYSFIPENLKFKGKDVYIGIITADDVDYTNDTLRTSDGKSRIACIWEQQKANQGNYYFKEQINEALEIPNGINMIKLPGAESMSTGVLGIAGGKSAEASYTGIATEAEFVVAKVKSATETIQRIYGGTPNKNSITMPDALVGIIKLLEFATQKNKPIVLCMPFNCNVDPHDGSLLLYQVLGLIAQNNSLTIIVPVGEEADKMHHYGIEGEMPSLEYVTLNVKKENQNIVGVMYQRFSNITTTILYPPRGVPGEPIDLKVPGITRLNETTVYSNGDKISFLNGASRILFRIDNPRIGEWRIEAASQTEKLSQTDIWISQQELNEFITFNPANPFKTIGSTANINTVMSVGGYDQDSMVVLRSSGRGYTWDNRVKPLFITHSNNILAPCGQSKWVSVSGTLPAASIMLGVVAILYSKFIEDQVFPSPNTLVMSNIILSAVEQSEGIEYPNPSQGYGIFDLQSLDQLIINPFVL